MKKMLYTVIFLIVLIVVVFAGCVSFEGPETETGDNGTSAASDTYVDTTVNTGSDVGNETNAAPEITDPNGETVTGNANQEVTSPTNGGSSETPTQQGTNATPQGKNEYDILRSGRFYMKGSMVDASGVTTPMDMAITENSLYALSSMDGIDMGVCINNGTTYLIYPEKNAYLEMSSTLMSLMGMKEDDLISADDLGFENFMPLSQANTVEQTTVNGKNCSCYIFYNDAGIPAKIYMDGNKLLRFESYNSAGKLESASNVDYITDNVPADKIDPSKSSYKKTGMIEFMKLMSDVIK